MKNTSLLVHSILSFEGTSDKIQLVCQFLYFFLFYIAPEFTQRISFLTFIEKKDFHHEFSFFNGFTQTHHPYAKRDRSFLLMLPKFGKFLVLYLGCGSMT